VCESEGKLGAVADMPPQDAKESGKGATKSNSKPPVPTTPIEASTPVKRKANTTGTDA
jgi:hypothetical protein